MIAVQDRVNADDLTLYLTLDTDVYLSVTSSPIAQAAQRLKSAAASNLELSTKNFRSTVAVKGWATDAHSELML